MTNDEIIDLEHDVIEEDGDEFEEEFAGYIEENDLIIKFEELAEPIRESGEDRRSFRKRIKKWKDDKKKQRVEREKENNLSEIFIRDIAETIKKESPNPAWACFETEILMEFIRLAIRKFLKDEGGIVAFKEKCENRDEMKEKIILAFETSDSALKITPEQAEVVNEAYRKGKALGGVPRKTLRKLLKLNT